PQVGGVVAVDRTGGRRPRGPQVGQLGLQALDLEPQHSSARKNEVTTPPGGSVSENSTASRLSTAAFPAGSTFRHLQQLTRSKRSADRQRLSSAFVPSAESQSKRLSATTTRFSFGRQMTSQTLTSASCRWVETTSRSSRSRATNFTGSMTRSLA